MKSVLISIQPKWVHKILDGKKTVEVRKTVPKIAIPFKCYIYMTSGGREWHDPFSTAVIPPSGEMYCGAMKVVAEFICDRIEEFTPTEKGVAFKRFRALYDTCLSVAEIREYLGSKVGYGWHISDLVIYDEPKPLNSFTKPYGTIVKAFDSPYIQRPPQSWCYVEG